MGRFFKKMFLQNSFRWSKDLIPWHGMMVLLEDENVKLPFQTIFKIKIL